MGRILTVDQRTRRAARQALQPDGRPVAPPALRDDALAKAGSIIEKDMPPDTKRSNRTSAPPRT